MPFWPNGILVKIQQDHAQASPADWLACFGVSPGQGTPVCRDRRLCEQSPVKRRTVGYSRILPQICSSGRSPVRRLRRQFFDFGGHTIEFCGRTAVVSQCLISISYRNPVSRYFQISFYRLLRILFSDDKIAILAVKIIRRCFSRIVRLCICGLRLCLRIMSRLPGAVCAGLCSVCRSLCSTRRSCCGIGGNFG